MNTDSYTAEEAMTVLKKARSTFFKEVDEGKIPWELEEGRQRGRRYPKQAIDTLARRGSQKRFKDRGPQHLVLAPSTVADLWSEVQMGIDLYGEDDVPPFDTLLEWRDVNEEMFMHLKDQGQSVGYSSLMPVEESILKALVHDKIRENDIPLNTIKQWIEPHLSVYIATLTIKPSGKQRIDTERGSFLIKETVKWALRLNAQYDIKNWYGIGATEKGQNLFERLGFEEIISLYNGERKGYFIEDVRKPVKLIKKVLADIQHKKSSETKQ